MPKRIPSEEMDAIAAVVARHSDGVAADGVRCGLSFALPPRTLQRRLSRLEGEGRIRSSGMGKGKRYLPVAPKAPTEKIGIHAVEHGEITNVEWVSKESMEIRRLVTLPASRRRPVGYDPAFLKSYQPNTTYYLPLATRQRLAEMGQVGITDLPAGTYLRQILDRLLIDLAWNSSRLEGNTYSLLETQRLLELGESAEGKATQEAQMILNHKAAIEMLADPTEEIGFNRYTICNLHALLSDNLLSDPAACGRLRTRPVGISGTVFHPLEVPQQIEENFHLILEKAAAIHNPFEAAFFMMVQLPYLQAFEDVNKRVSRLAANIPMIRANFCPLSFVDVEADDYVNALIGIYELQRIEYLRDVFIWAYSRSAQRYSAVRQSLGDPDAFRLRYRSQIGNLVREVVQGGLSATKAGALIRHHAENAAPYEDQSRLIELMELELLSLHEGNIARYRLRPGEFAQWKGGKN
jgi:Fic family protein